MIIKEGEFFLNNHNKQVFLEMLGTQSSIFCTSAMHSDGDADVDISFSALTVEKTCPVTIFGE